MSLELHDTASFNGTITNTSSETLTVNTRTAEHFEVLVDDTSGGTPASYDLTVEFYSTAEDSFIQRDSVSSSTAHSPSVTKDARGQQVRITLTNSSGGDTSYRISLESFERI